MLYRGKIERRLDRRLDCPLHLAYQLNIIFELLSISVTLPRFKVSQWLARHRLASLVVNNPAHALVVVQESAVNNEVFDLSCLDPADREFRTRVSLSTQNPTARFTAQRPLREFRDSGFCAFSALRREGVVGEIVIDP